MLSYNRKIAILEKVAEDLTVNDHILNGTGKFLAAMYATQQRNKLKREAPPPQMYKDVTDSAKFYGGIKGNPAPTKGTYDNVDSSVFANKFKGVPKLTPLPNLTKTVAGE